MPIHRGRDNKGPYFQWGNQKKYYYMAGDRRSRERAYQRAVKQAQAIYSHGYR
jgi:hypothetical protein